MLDDNTTADCCQGSQLLRRPQYPAGRRILTGESPVDPDETPVLASKLLSAERFPRAYTFDHVAGSVANTQCTVFQTLIKQ